MSAFTLNGYKFKEYNGSNFVLIFRHKYPSGGTFSVNECMKSLKKNRFSVIGSIDERFKINNNFHFLLEYPEFDAHLEWEQKLAITSDTNNVQAIVYNASFGSFYGLGQSESTSYTCFDGSPKSPTEYWWYSVGMINPYTGYNIPGPVFNNSHYVKEVLLWIKFDKIMNLDVFPKIYFLCTNKLTRSRASPFLFIIIFLLCV